MKIGMRKSAVAGVLFTLMLLSRLAIAQTPPSPSAAAHLDEIISVLQREWLHRDSMDWRTFRQRVFERAGSAQTIPDTYDAIKLALSLLGDKHTYYIPASGPTLFNPQSPTQVTAECTPAPFVAPAVPADVGYVRIQITPQTPAAEIQDALRKGDRPTLVGWIVDLRDSRGGNMWPALAGIGSLLGDGIAGYFIGQNETSWGYAGGEAWLERPDQGVATIESPYKLAKANSRVAVLTDIGVASSGEAIAVAFRGRANTRSFGTATCGLSTAVAQFPLATGGRLAVVTSVMADRLKRKYGGRIEPDERITDPGMVLSRAIAWLRMP